MINKKDIFKALYDTDAFLIGKFTLASGRESNYYVDAKKLFSHPTQARVIFNAWEEMYKRRDDVDFIAAPATAGYYFGSILADRLEKPFIGIRKEKKGHGTEKLIDGEFEEGSRGLLIDDVGTTLGSLIKGAKAIVELGGIPIEGSVIVDREEWWPNLWRETFPDNAEELQWSPLATATELVEYGVSIGKVEEKVLEEVKARRRQ